MSSDFPFSSSEMLAADEGAGGTGSNTPPFMTVSELSQRLKVTVESAFDFVRIRAEISRPTRAASGHLYFTLKDDRNTLDAVCWKTVAGNLGVQPEEGLEVIVTGKLTIYGGRSKYQIVCSRWKWLVKVRFSNSLRNAVGGLLLKGCLMLNAKSPFPACRCHRRCDQPDRGGHSRYPAPAHGSLRCACPCLGTLVQGQGAAAKVAAAIRRRHAGRQAAATTDLLIVARGGGSLEDLWSFNEEEVVRAVADCSIPLISAIGHETDTTLIDCLGSARPDAHGGCRNGGACPAELMARLGESGCG